MCHFAAVPRTYPRMWSEDSPVSPIGRRLTVNLYCKPVGKFQILIGSVEKVRWEDVESDRGCFWEGLGQLVTLELKFEWWEGGGHLKIRGRTIQAEIRAAAKVMRWEGYAMFEGQKADPDSRRVMNEGQMEGWVREGLIRHEGSGKAFAFYSK